jgi:tetratricopeptide (TPR) repeat protein
MSSMFVLIFIFLLMGSGVCAEENSSIISENDSIYNGNDSLNLSSIDSGLNLSYLLPVESLPDTNFSTKKSGIESPLDHQETKRLIYIGNIYYNNTEYEEALYYYERASLLAPNNKQIWYNKGTALCKLGRGKEATIDLKKALLLDPDYEKALINMNIALQQSKPLTNLRLGIWVFINSIPNSVWIWLDGKNTSKKTNDKIFIDGRGEYKFELKNCSKVCSKNIPINAPKENVILEFDMASCKCKTHGVDNYD